MDIAIRTATIEDAEAIAEHNILMAQETEDYALDRATVTAGVKGMFGSENRGFYLVAEAEGSVIGSLMITFEWSDWRNANMWWFQSVYIRENFRRKGIFSKMYEKIQQMAENEGVVLLRLYVEKENSRAKSVYKSLGMSECRYLMYEAPLGVVTSSD